MKERIAVRLLLFDRDNRILLMKIHDPAVTGVDGGASIPCWITLGGGLEPGETVMDAAAREGLEESGIAGLQVGPAVHYAEQTLVIHGEPVLFKETFVVMHAPHTTLDASGWTEDERQIVKDMRWWTLVELQATDEVVFPVGLAEMLKLGCHPAT